MVSKLVEMKIEFLEDLGQRLFSRKYCIKIF